MRSNTFRKCVLSKVHRANNWNLNPAINAVMTILSELSLGAVRKIEFNSESIVVDAWSHTQQTRIILFSTRVAKVIADLDNERDYGVQLKVSNEIWSLLTPYFSSKIVVVKPQVHLESAGLDFMVPQG